MLPMHGVTVYHETVEGEDPSFREIVLKNSPFLAIGYLVDGGELQLISREAYHTNGIILLVIEDTYLFNTFFIDIFEEYNGFYTHILRKDSIIVHINGEKTNPLPFVSPHAVFMNIIYF